MSRKKIAIISPYTFGYIDFVANKLEENQSIDFTYINIDSIQFAYKTKLSRISNGFRKLLKVGNLKDMNRTQHIQKMISDQGEFDQIFIIRPDRLQMQALQFLRSNSKEMICYLFDGIQNFKNQRQTVSFFDTIYSYDRQDVEHHGFLFLPNFIYDEQIEKLPIQQQVFNISSYDKRFAILEKWISVLKNKGITFRFIVKKNRVMEHSDFEFVKHYLSLEEVKKHIAASTTLMDIQKDRQTGLSFRVFEALGYRKKLITNNSDIVNYDFYNPNNIFVVNNENPDIPMCFFETSYQEINPDVLSNYRLETWIQKVFKL